MSFQLEIHPENTLVSRGIWGHEQSCSARSPRRRSCSVSSAAKAPNLRVIPEVNLRRFLTPLRFLRSRSSAETVRSALASPLVFIFCCLAAIEGHGSLVRKLYCKYCRKHLTLQIVPIIATEGIIFLYYKIRGDLFETCFDSTSGVSGFCYRASSSVLFRWNLRHRQR